MRSRRGWRRVLEAGDLLVLSGELGAGKTTFTQGLGEGLGVRAGIISPTFVLVRIHPNLPDGPRPGGPDLVHVDAYRLGSAAEIDDIDLENTMDTVRHRGGVGPRPGGAPQRQPAGDRPAPGHRPRPAELRPQVRCRRGSAGTANSRTGRGTRMPGL